MSEEHLKQISMSKVCFCRSFFQRRKYGNNIEKNIEKGSKKSLCLKVSHNFSKDKYILNKIIKDKYILNKIIDFRNKN